MEQCVYCRKPGLLVDRKGLCSMCRATIMLEVAAKMDIIYTHSRLVQTSESLEERLSGCDLIIECAKALLPFEKMGVEVAPPFPSEIISITKETKDEIIHNQAEKEVDQWLSDVQSRADGSQSNSATKLLTRLKELKALMYDSSKLDELEERVRNNLNY